MSPVTYPGEDIDAWCTDLRTKIKNLQNSGQYNHELTKTIVTQAMLAGGDNHEDWRVEVRAIKKELLQKLTEIGLLATKKDVWQLPN